MAEFDKTYNQLNDEQRLAVDTIDGPLLVIAGPGTGKTQLLSARVANILKKTDADASSILCLTFTNKAATNMRDRLTELIGIDAHRVVVKTFHSFAAEIMNIYPEYFWNGARLSTAPDAVQIEIIQDILTRLPLDNPLAMKFAGQFTAINDVQKGLKLAKEAGLTPEKLAATIKLNEAYIDVIESELVEILSETLNIKKLDELRDKIDNLPPQGISEEARPLLPLDTIIKESLAEAITLDEGTNKTENTGKWKRRWIQTVAGQKGMFDERKRNSWWRSLADVYQSYRTELHNRGYYDYADMLVEVISQLEQRDDLRADIQERFLYVLIDEFQDTNDAQMRLAHLVSDHHSANNKPNIMAVGDDDQSIFRFNGAELNNMLGFSRSYPSAKLIVLTENYRSSQDVLDTAAKVIDHAEDRIVKRRADISKELIAKNPPIQKSTILHRSYNSREEQLSDVAKNIEAQKSYSSTAVIARNHSSLRMMADLLLRKKVPVRYEQQRNILDHEIVQQLELLADAVLAIKEGDVDTVNFSISRLLRYPAWGIDAKDLWQIAVENYRNPNWLDTMTSSSNNTLSSTAEWLHWLSSENAHQPLPVLIEHLLGLRESEVFTSPIRQYYFEKKRDNDDYLHGLSAVQLLRSAVDDFIKADQQATLTDFLRFLQIHRENQQFITDESPFVQAEDSVELLTVHKSKGLEFDRVYIIDTVEGNWQPRAGGRKPPANLPLQPHGDDDDDYARMMYVAVTRAKRDVIATSYRFDHAGQEVLPTPLIRNSFSKIKDIEAQDTSTIIQTLEEHLRWPVIEAGQMNAYLRGRLEDYQLSVTHLLNFLDVTAGGPKYFTERNLLRLPSAKTTSMGFGTAMHSVLQEAQLQRNRGELSIKALEDIYENALAQERLEKQEHARYRQHGIETIHRLFNTIGLDLPRGSKPEQSFQDILVGKARLSGKIDRLDYINKTQVRVVDYKTGRPLRSFATKDKLLQEKVWRQKTQLIFYAVLLQHSPRFSDSIGIEGEMIYLEAENKNDLSRSYHPSKEDISRMESLIGIVWQKITSLDFIDTSNYEDSFDGIVQFEEDLLSHKI